MPEILVKFCIECTVKTQNLKKKVRSNTTPKYSYRTKWDLEFEPIELFEDDLTIDMNI